MKGDSGPPDDGALGTLTALEAALWYADRGIRIFPGVLKDGRRQPAVRAFYDTATDDRAQIESWWTKWPDAWVAVATGPTNDLVVIDQDVKHRNDGISAWNALRPDQYKFRGPQARTATGGLHDWYRFEGWDKLQIRNSASDLAPGVDVRAWHGFVWAPPSGGRKWITDPPDFRGRVAKPSNWVPDLPEWALELIAAPRRKAETRSGERSSLAQLLRDVPRGEGSRNIWLSRVAGHYANQYRDQRDSYELQVRRAATLLHPELDADEVKRTLESIWNSEQSKVNDDDSTQSKQRARLLVATSLAGTRMRRMTYLWGNKGRDDDRPGGRLPMASVSLLGGREGVGKSTIAYDLAGALSRGALPGEHYGTPTGVFIIATEDSFAHTVVPRLVAAGADLERVHRVEPVDATVGTGITLPVDLPHLTALVREHDARLAILDPLMSRLGVLDTHKDADVRQALEPLAAFAEESGCAVLGLIHVNKTATNDPLTSLMGSRAFAAVARSVLYTLYDPDDPTRAKHLLTHPKCNVGPTMPSLTYTIAAITVGEDDGPIVASKIAWGAEDERTASELLTAANNAIAKRPTKAEAAADWLFEYLTEHGPSKGSTVKLEGGLAGHSYRTLQRAAKDCGVHYETAPGDARERIWKIPF